MRIIIACGGSGGHLFPGIALAQELRSVEKDCEIIFIGSRRNLDRHTLMEEGFPFITSSVGPMPEGVSLRFIPFVISLAWSMIESLTVLKRARPNIVIGFGSFTSGPIVLCARMLRIPTVIHEQNVFPGRANSMLSRFADAIAVSFKESEKFFKEKCKIVFTGNPIRDSLNKVDKEEALKLFDFQPGNFTLFVMGGSQGSHSINQFVIKVFEKFDKEERKKFQVIHTSGDKDYNALQYKYEDLGIKARLYNFLDRVNYAYCASDLVISRAGATAISEIAFFGKSSILIPYPFARSHQLTNAQYMTKQNKSILLQEDKDLVEHLYHNISYFCNNRGRAKTDSTGAEKNASKNLAELILNLKNDDKI